MSLDYDYRECDDALLTDEHFERTCMTVVFHTMFVGMPHITKDNYVEFALRWGLFEAASGHQTMSLGERVAMVIPWIGLRTNVTPMTKAQFRKRIAERIDHTLNLKVWESA